MHAASSHTPPSLCADNLPASAPAEDQSLPSLDVGILPQLARGAKPCRQNKCAGRQEVVVGPTKHILRCVPGCHGVCKEQS